MKRLTLFILFSCSLVKGKAQLTIYPNPFSLTTTIAYSISTTDTVTLEVIDMLGQIKEKLINDSVVNIGTYTIGYHPTNLSAGIYFISLITKHGATITKKIIYQGSASTIQSISNQNSIHLIYPNPANKIITVNYEGVKRIEIIDFNGRIIKTISTPDKSVSIEEIKVGEYFITVYFENKLVASQKILKTE
jgi:hypothetical protein